jgi:REP element-mobilizing transposase RayT
MESNDQRLKQAVGINTSSPQIQDKSLRAHCRYHLVLTPNPEFKDIFVERYTDLLRVFTMIAHQQAWTAPWKGFEIIEYGISAHYVSLYIEIPPRLSVRWVVLSLKRKSVLELDYRSGKHGKLDGKPFWADGYGIETLGPKLDIGYRVVQPQ